MTDQLRNVEESVANACLNRGRTIRYLHYFGFYRASSYASAILAVIFLGPSARLSVRLSVTRVLCNETKQCTSNILRPHEKAITLVF